MSAAVPLVELEVVVAPIGVPGHHWAVTSCAVHPMGFTGMAVAAKVLGATAVDLLRETGIVKTAHEELAKATGGQEYKSPLTQDAKPRVF